MTPEEEARKMTTCGRAACQKYIGAGGRQHRYLPWRYCIDCARKINAANKDLPGRTVELPFDLSDIEGENVSDDQVKATDTTMCPTTTGELVPKKCACGLDLAELHASGKEGHICSAVAGPGDPVCRGEWRDEIACDGERVVSRCFLKEGHAQACAPQNVPRGLWPQVITGEALERAAIKFTGATQALSNFEYQSRNTPLIGILGAREEAARRRRYLRAATYDHVAALMRANGGDRDTYWALEVEAENLRKETP